MLIPTGALVVLAGPSGSGKSTWAASNFRADQIVSSDALRATVGLGVDDHRAGTDAFDVLADIVARRMKRGLTTVVDSLGIDSKQRARWIEAARHHGRTVHAVAFDTTAAACHRRNKARARPVPSKALSSQLARWPDAGDELAAEVDELHAVDLTEDAPPPPEPELDPPTEAPDASPDLPAESSVRLVPPPLHAYAGAHGSTARFRFGLTVSSFTTWPGETADIGPTLAAIARDAEDVGFSSLWVMDHVVQIPQVGREWEPILEARRPSATWPLRPSGSDSGRSSPASRIATSPTSARSQPRSTYSRVGGRRAGSAPPGSSASIGHTAGDSRRSGTSERYELLEDALELPLAVSIYLGAEAFWIDNAWHRRPRLMVVDGGGSSRCCGAQGHRRSRGGASRCPRRSATRARSRSGSRSWSAARETAARCGSSPATPMPATCSANPMWSGTRSAVLHEHCAAEDRDPSDITVTQLSSTLWASDVDDLDRRLTKRAGGRMPVEILASELNAGIVDDHLGRFAALAETGVDEVIVALADVGDPGAVERFAPVIAAFAN